jgi:transposase
MFLKKSKKTYKGKVYETYALTESYREENKVKHRHITNLGPLTTEQAQRIRLVLKAQQIEGVFVGHLSDVVAKIHYRFLDVAVLDDFWQQFNLDNVFPDLPYAEAMAINRCLEPKSKINIRDWTDKTVLPRLQKYEYNDDYGVYRALDAIADRESELQQHLYQTYQQLGIIIRNTIFYDITSSYFEGTKCILASYGYSRDHRPDRQQIVIALVVTPDGYPLYWQVMPGNTQDVTTVEGLVSVLQKRFGIEQCLLVFDRGMVSGDNLKAIAEKKFTYVSALDKDEIPGLGFVEPEFPSLLAENWKENILAHGFEVYDQNLLYREHFHKNMRYLLAFNRNLYQDQQKNRQECLQKTKEYIANCNKELGQARKSRNQKTTECKIETHLRKWNMHKVLSWELEPAVITVPISKGNEKKVNSFRVLYTIDEDKLKEQERLDGILCFLTNEPPENLSSEQVIGYYRRKNKIEDAFREIKSYLRLRPFHLTREKRVKAHVTICVLGYLLLNALEEKLNQFAQPQSGPSALEIFRQCLLNRIGPQKSDTFVESITEVTDEQAELLKSLGMEQLIENNYLSKILEYSTM